MTEDEKSRFDLIYSRHAAEYHELVAAEDWQGNLPRALGGITSFAGKAVVELGAGTGRVTMLVAPLCARVLAFDRSRHMLDKAAENVKSRGLKNVSLAVCDNTAVPLGDGSADVVIEGWSFGHTISQAGSQWQNVADALLKESTRLLKRDGVLIVMETLGTGFRMPSAPGSVLPLFYGYMEKQLGFSAQWIRTDYRFPSLGEARRLVELFFGAMVEYDLAEDRQVIVPECTGLWWRQK